MTSNSICELEASEFFKVQIGVVLHYIFRPILSRFFLLLPASPYTSEFMISKKCSDIANSMYLKLVGQIYQIINNLVIFRSVPKYNSTIIKGNFGIIYFPRCQRMCSVHLMIVDCRIGVCAVPTNVYFKTI